MRRHHHVSSKSCWLFPPENTCRGGTTNNNYRNMDIPYNNNNNYRRCNYNYFSTHAGESDRDYELTQIVLEQHRNDHRPNTTAVEEPAAKGRRRRLDIAIVGLPNAGKSQLLNVITGAPVSAVSRKRHTTRKGIMAAKTVTEPNDDDDLSTTTTTTQLLFVDTPGFVNVANGRTANRGVKSYEKLDRDLMISEARREMVAVDFTVIVIDAARRFTPDVRAATVELMLMALESQGRIEELVDDDDDDDEEDDSQQDDDDEEEVGREPILPLQKFAVVLNKVDLIHPKSSLLHYAFEIGAVAQECLHYKPEQSDVQPDNSNLSEVMPTFFYTSALQNDGVDDLVQFLLQKATPTKVFEVEPGTATNSLPEEQSEEIIREKIYRCLHKELPYQIEQKNRVFRVVKNPESGKLGLHIEQDLIVASKSHQELVRGRGNRTLERIRESAEFSMKTMFRCDVTLKLEVRFQKSKNQGRNI